MYTNDKLMNKKNKTTSYVSCHRNYPMTDVSNVVRIILRRIGWPVKERKHEERNKPLKGRIVTSHAHTQT